MIKIILTLLLTCPAFALNDSMLGMPKDQAYMNFVMKKYLAWNRGIFKFPEESPLISALTEKLDHWLVEGTMYYQVTFTHGVDDSKKYFQKIRLYVAPELRRHKDLQGSGLPSSGGPWFYETDDSGRVCLLFRQSETLFTSWCRKSSREKFEPAWTEEMTERVSEKWPFPFPYLGRKYISVSDKNGVKEVHFFRVAPHPSRMPEALYRPVFHNTKDALFPLDRVSTSIGGGLSVHYP